jgi:nucleotide-binding universal stress UspA family protein
MFASILVGTDGSEAAGAAVTEATRLAAALRARLLIVSVYESPAAEPRLSHEHQVPAQDSQWSVGPREEVLKVLEQAAATAGDAGVANVETIARQGDAADAIIDVAEDHACDLIVVGNRGLTGAKRFLLGSVPNKISHHAPCSVLIVRSG